MRRNRNIEVIVQIIILTGIAALLAAGMITGKVNNYIHPRYHLGIWISIAVLLLFIIRLLTDLKTARHNVNLRPYFLFAVPVCIAILFPADGTGKGDMAIAKGMVSADRPGGTGEGTNTAAQEDSDGILTDTEEEIIDYTNNPDNLLTSPYDTEYDSSEDGSGNTLIFPGEETAIVYDDMSDKYKGVEIDGATVINDDNFAAWYYDTYDYLSDFTGKRYRFLAQVYPTDEFGENRFLAGRYIMVCCAADASGYGLVCENDISGSLKENEWITVTGTIQEYDYQGSKIPMLTDTVITKAKAPREEYVYFNFY